MTTGTVPARTLVPGFADLRVDEIDDVDIRAAGGSERDRAAVLLAPGGATTRCPTLATSPLERCAAPRAIAGTSIAGAPAA